MAAAVVNQATTAAQALVTSPLKEGTKLPSNLIKEDDAQKATVDLSALKGRNIVLGVPGAFSPGCSSQAPGYVEQAQKFQDKGVQAIYIVAVNDVFVVKAWKEAMGAKDSKFLHFLADDTAAFTAATGLSFDGTAVMGNRRSHRYAAIVDDGVVSKIFQEGEIPSVTVTSADNVLQHV